MRRGTKRGCDRLAALAISRGGSWSQVRGTQTPTGRLLSPVRWELKAIAEQVRAYLASVTGTVRRMTGHSALSLRERARSSRARSDHLFKGLPRNDSAFAELYARKAASA